MALLSLHEPVRLTRTPIAYKVGTKVPIELASMYLEDTAFLQVNVYFQNTVDSPRFPIFVPLTAGFWNIGPAGARLKKSPGEHPTVSYTPLVPGYYTVQVVVINFTATGPVNSFFESAPTPVTA